MDDEQEGLLLAVLRVFACCHGRHHPDPGRAAGRSKVLAVPAAPSATIQPGSRSPPEPRPAMRIESPRPTLAGESGHARHISG